MSRNWLRQGPLALGLICALGIGTAAFGQGDDAVQPPESPAKKKADDGKEKADPAKKAPPAETPESDPAEAPASDPPTATDQPAKTAADPAADQAAFMAILEEWKTVLKSLRALTPRYALASEAEAEGIRQEWDTLIAKGEELIPRLRTAGVNAYISGRGGNRTVERFLTKLLEDDITHDRFEFAYELGTSLIDNGCEIKEVLDATGIAAFCTNHFDVAEAFLKRAMEAGSLSEPGRNYLTLVDDYKMFWAEEKVLREKEAAADDLPRVKITTNRGVIVAELLENEAPDTVGNFVDLVETKKFYDGLTFHRVLPGFMAQGGCPQGDGSGGPGYTIMCETDAENRRNHFRGSLSMAHAGPNTGGSQFFLTFAPTAHLNGKHTVFGRVIEGMEVLANLKRIDPSKQEGPPVTPDKIIKIEVLRKRNHEYKPNKSQ